MRDFLNRGANFDLGQITAMMTQLLQALDFAHERGVVHRDIKPANLILTKDGALKVADFGIARIDTSNLTTMGMVMGTPSYMSPEQCQGQPVDRRSDLFSAAVVLYELLTGEKPFAGALETIGYKICHENPRPPSTIARLSLSPTIDAVVATALEKNPEARFQNARAFNRALRQSCDALVADDALGATEINLAAVRMGPPPAAAAWDETMLRTIERQLATYLGPMAKVMIRKAAAQTHDVNELYTLLAESITDPAGRQRFMSSTPGGTHPPQVVATGQTSKTQTLPLDKDFVDQTTMRLAAYLGPIAKVVVNRAAQKACNQHEFVQLVAGHLGTQERGAFLQIRFTEL